MKKLLRYIFHFDHWIVASLAVMLTFVLAAIFMALGLKNPYLKSVSNNSLTETFYKYSTAEEDVAISDNVVVVDIGARSNRSHVADLLAQIDSLQPLAVGVDAIFPKPANEVSDSRLKKVLLGMKEKVVLAQMTDEDGNRIKSFFVDSLGLRSGSIMLDVDDATIHTFSAMDSGDSTMVAILNDMWNVHYGIANPLVLTDEPITIDYNYDFEVITSDSLADYADQIEGRIVLLGQVTSGTDNFRVPSNRGYMPGVEIHAAALETLHSTDSYPFHIPLWVNVLLAFILCYLFDVLLYALRTRFPDTKRPWLIFIREWVKSSYLTNIVLLPMLAVLTVFMMNATLHGRYYMLTFIFTAVLLVVESRNIYQAALKAFRAKYKWKWLKKSLITE